MTPGGKTPDFVSDCFSLENEIDIPSITDKFRLKSSSVLLFGS